MAIAVGHCHDLKPPPAARGRHYRPHSLAQLDHQETNPNAAAGGSLSPQRRSLSSPCFTTAAVAPAGADNDDHAANNDDKANMLPRVEIVAGRHAPGVHELIAEAAGAMASGTRLVPAQGGLGGALLLNDGRSGEHVAVIKPLEDDASNGDGGGYESEAVLREVAAFLLDHGGFASVSPTALIRISRPDMDTTTMASIQRFVAHSHDAGELGPSRFSATSVHRVGILDVRLLNIDRHAGNILVKNDTTGTDWAAPLELVPIDHGLCLPERLEDPYFEWLHWPQASMPFSAEELRYIASLDAPRDAELLREELPALTEPAIRILTLCTVFLQRAAAAGLCLADIGDMMTREFSSAEEGVSVSELEALCNKAVDDGDRRTEESSPRHVSFGELSAEEWAAFLEKFERLLPPAFEAKMKKL